MSMQNLMMGGNMLLQMQTMQSASKKLQGRANVLKSELKTDSNPSESKKEQVEELESRASDIVGHLMETAQKTNEDLKQNEATTEEKDQATKPKEDAKNAVSQKTVTDQVDISETSHGLGSMVAEILDSHNGYSYTSTGSPQSEPTSSLKVDITA